MSASAEMLGHPAPRSSRKGARRGVWSAREIADLLHLLATTDLHYEAIGLRVGHDAKAVQNKVCYLRARGHVIAERKGSWSEADQAELIRLRHEGLSDPDIAVRLNRGIAAIKSRLDALRSQGIKFPSRVINPPPMSAAQREALARRRAAAAARPTGPVVDKRFDRGIAPEEKAAPVEIITRKCKGAHCNGNVFRTNSRFIFRCRTCRERRE